MPDLYRTRTLTANERLIIALLAEGLENEDIAGQIRTFGAHTKRTLQTIFDTTGCCTRLELALWDFCHDPQSQ
jgi:DNA-binding NarL/FixJ family response regulator